MGSNGPRTRAQMGPGPVTNWGPTYHYTPARRAFWLLCSSFFAFKKICNLSFWLPVAGVLLVQLMSLLLFTAQHCPTHLKQLLQHKF